VANASVTGGADHPSRYVSATPSPCGGDATRPPAAAGGIACCRRGGRR